MSSSVLSSGPAIKKLSVPVLSGVSFAHLLNDSLQAVIPATFPLLQEEQHLSYTELGVLAFANHLTASILQPFIGSYTDKRPMPWLLPVGMIFTGAGMIGLAFGTGMFWLLLAVMGVGIGSAIFHPESSRIVSLAGGQKKGTAQAIFQLGGNSGQALAPLFSVWIIKPLGQAGAALFAPIAAAVGVLLYVLAGWYKRRLHLLPSRSELKSYTFLPQHRRQAQLGILLIMAITFARTWYFTGINNYYALYRISIWKDTLEVAQTYVFVFMLASAFGTLIGGAVADRFGRRNALFYFTFISAPLAALLPYSSGIWTYLLLAASGCMIVATFAVTITYTMLLMPGRVGKVSGLVFGLAFGLAALGALVLGKLSDFLGIDTAMTICSFIPLAGLAAWFLPKDQDIYQWHKAAGIEDKHA